MLQIFDTWAGSLPPREFETWVVAPTRRIVTALRAKHPHVPIIGFPRGAGQKIGRYVAETGVQGVGCDTGMDVEHMRALAGSGQVVVQGNLDPMALVAGGQALRTQAEALLQGLAGVPHIFNLGHGILPETPVEHVAWLVERVRGQARELGSLCAGGYPSPLRTPLRPAIVLDARLRATTGRGNPAS